LPNVVGVRFKRAGKVYYFDPGELTIASGDQVIVETARGVEYGEVVVGPKPVGEDEVVAPLKRVIRLANEKDAAEIEENRRREREALAVCAKKVTEHGLEMNLIDCEYTFDGSKIIFYFTAEGRVDFRELVRDLAATFRTRIELRQIGVRDEAKMLGGLGPCGRCVCCSSFLGDFAPVSIKMAKEQNLSLNPTKISGLCGRLMCCLRYECDHYDGAKTGSPEVGAAVITPQGEGRVAAQNPARSIISVEFEDQTVVDFPAEDVERKEPRRESRAKGGNGTKEAEPAAAQGTPETAKPPGEKPRDKKERGPKAPEGA
jgi:cell fate regulator YaaT (PSP1 superfamily)